MSVQHSIDPARTWWEQHRGIKIETLMASGMALAVDPLTAHGALPKFVDRLIDIESRSSGVPLTIECGAFAVGVLEDAFERGWQPVELVHVLRRRTNDAAVKMVMPLIGEHARRTCALSSAPQEWRDQLRELDADPAAELGRFRAVERIDPRTFWTTLLRLLAQLRLLPTMVPVGAPPSRWGETAPTQASQRPDGKILNKIRGLLAKAESSTYAAEAETFSTKAQELMARYAIDSAVLDARADGPVDDRVVTRRFTVDNPYIDAKMRLLFEVANANGVRTVRFTKLGLTAVVGMPVDIDLCELLYTSLLIQSSRAMEEVGTHPSKRSKGFRRSFLFGYADRIGGRLHEARMRADRGAGEQYGRTLVPILAERDRAVDTKVADLYPNLTRGRRISMANSSGWHDGRKAADSADLTGGRERIDE